MGRREESLVSQGSEIEVGESEGSLGEARKAVASDGKSR